jgi:hypothetical protein
MTSAKQLAMTITIAGPCPTCDYKHVIRKTKDTKSEFLGIVVCGDDSCPYEDTFKKFRKAVKNIRRAKRGLPPVVE